MTQQSGEIHPVRKVDQALALLVHAARVDPHLRDAALLVEREVHRLRGLDALRDLEQRLSDKAVELAEASQASRRMTWAERERLRLRAEGVDLALSFVQSAIEAAESGSSRGSDV